MKKLEAFAVMDYAAAGNDPMKCKEYVALGFEDPIDECITWFELPNVAGPGEFLVEQDAVQAVLKEALDPMYGLDPQSAVYLWHSHSIDVNPSEADVSNFPEWVNAGIVFHAPSGTSTLYNAAGIISNNASNVPQLATKEAGNG